MTNLKHWIAEISGHTPADLSLFEQALTHGSTGRKDYQRLEFLGDRVLGLAVANMLYRQFPDEPEGQLAKRLNNLVDKASCAEVARRVGLAEHMTLGKQARDDGAKESENVLGDMIEAVIGALYLDGGPPVADEFVRTHWSQQLANGGVVQTHAKSALQEWAAAHGRRTPVYDVVERSGPPHAPEFTVSVTIKGFDPVLATGSSKQDAQTRAARLFMERNIK